MSSLHVITISMIGWSASIAFVSASDVVNILQHHVVTHLLTHLEYARRILVDAVI